MKSLLFLFTSVALSQAAPITLVPFEDTFKRPVDLQQAKGGKSPMVVVEQDGKIFVVDPLTGAKVNEVMDLTGYVSRTHNEEGLLGLAFSPSFEKDHRFYVYYTKAELAEGQAGKRKPKVKSREARIARFTMDPETLVADRKGEEVLLSFKQDFGNHNGGWIGFGPDGYLYFGAGDGGAGNDPKQRAQDLSNVLGSLLRIDVSGEKGYVVPEDNPFLEVKDARPEIFAYGLRNPWRCSFDRVTGDFWIADVGQNKREEINKQPANSIGGENYGWKVMEGNNCFDSKPDCSVDTAPCFDDSYTYPVFEYPRDYATGGVSVTGGFVYRGSDFPKLYGYYICADYGSNNVWAIDGSGNVAGFFSDIGDNISSFGEDENGELYAVSLYGTIYRVTER